MSKALVFVGYNCNESCFFCSAEVANRKHINYTSLQLLKLLKEKRIENDEVEFIGGEMLIRKDALLLIRFCKQLKYKEIIIETNGTKLSDIIFFENLLKSGLTRIVMSIHGSNCEINDLHTGLKNSFILKDLALKNADLLFEKYSFSMFTNFVVTSKNLFNVPEFIEYIQQFTYLSRYIFAFCRPLNSYASIYNDYLASFEDIKSIFEGIPMYEKVRLQYLPLCVLNNERSELFQEGFQRGNKFDTTRLNVEGESIKLEVAIQDHTKYFQECTTCIKKNNCRGVWSEYSDHFHLIKPPLLS